MEAQLIRIETSTKHDRHQMITAVEQAVAESGGGIIDFKMFSNMAITLHIEIDSDKLPELLKDLLATELVIDQKSQQVMLNMPPRQEVTVWLYITFIHNDRDLRIEVPAVPG